MPTYNPGVTEVYFPGYSGSQTKSFKQEFKDWVRTANFKALRSSGDLPVNPFQHWRMLGETQGRYHVRNDTPGGSSVVGPFWDTASAQFSRYLGGLNRAFALISSEATIKNRLTIGALVKASDAKTNLPVMMAEASKTSQLILGRAKVLANAYRAFRRGNLREVARHLDISPKKVHKTWLEYKYGWMPLLLDVKGSAEFFGQQVMGRPLRFSVSATEFTNPVDINRWTAGSICPGALQTITETTTVETRWSVRLHLEVINQHLSAIQQLGITNPALVAWELTPFSFVADWFIHVGNYLQALTALDGLLLRKAAFSSKSKVLYVWDQIEPGGTYNGGSSSFVPLDQPHHTVDVLSFHRESFSVDLLSLYPPRKQNPCSWDHVFTGAALLRAVTGKR